MDKETRESIRRLHEKIEGFKDKVVENEREILGEMGDMTTKIALLKWECRLAISVALLALGFRAAEAFNVLGF